MNRKPVGPVAACLIITAASAVFVVGAVELLAAWGRAVLG